jgi:hypothetical protein
LPDKADKKALSDSTGIQGRKCGQMMPDVQRVIMKVGIGIRIPQEACARLGVIYVKRAGGGSALISVGVGLVRHPPGPAKRDGV